MRASEEERKKNSMRIEDTEPSWLEIIVHRVYLCLIAPLVANPLAKQRIKLFWFAPGYWPLLFIPALPLRIRMTLLIRFLGIDWHVLLGHTPFQCAAVCRALAEVPGQPGEAMVEAGCWNGGSSAKWSILCKLLGYQLVIYDSFEGVEHMKPLEWEHDFSGEYAAEEQVVWENLKTYGEADVCQTIRGWFSDTMAAGKVPFKVRLAYIDCDIAKGTKEALIGVVPALTEKGYIFSQDCHIPSVLKLLTNTATWSDLQIPAPLVKRLDRYLVRFTFETAQTS